MAASADELPRAHHADSVMTCARNPGRQPDGNIAHTSPSALQLSAKRERGRSERLVRLLVKMLHRSSISLSFSVLAVICLLRCDFSTHFTFRPATVGKERDRGRSERLVHLLVKILLRSIVSLSFSVLAVTCLLRCDFSTLFTFHPATVGKERDRGRSERLVHLLVKILLRSIVSLSFSVLAVTCLLRCDFSTHFTFHPATVGKERDRGRSERLVHLLVKILHRSIVSLSFSVLAVTCLLRCDFSTHFTFHPATVGKERDRGRSERLVHLLVKILLRSIVSLSFSVLAVICLFVEVHSALQQSAKREREIREAGSLVG